MKHTIYALTMFALAACTSPQEEAIDRHALVTRNNPEVTAMDSLSSLSVGNGEFAYTVDATGLQTFPEVYKNGVPLGTQSQWGWHSFGNPENYKPEEALVEYDFGHGHKELYATQPKEPGRAKEASDWYRVNPHRLHLGIIGLEPLPLSYFPWLVGILLSYCVLTQMIKNWYIKRFVKWL